MPISPMKWRSVASMDADRVEQVFGASCGTKRKMDGLQDAQDGYGLENLFCETQGKRLCTWPQTPESQPAPAEQPPAGQYGEEMMATQEDNLTTSPTVSQESSARAEPHANDEMMMNINDDDGMADVTEYQAACDAMDGEGSVNPAQYGSASAVAGAATVQHHSHCFGAERSPNSGSVRCYCRPTWDTMRCSYAFFSDIY